MLRPLLLTLFVGLFILPAWAKFNSDTANFGVVAPETKGAHTFIYTNNTKSPVTLKLNSTTSLSKFCKVVALTVKPISPGKTGAVKMECQFEHIFFDQNVAVINVMKNGVKNPVTLKVKVKSTVDRCAEVDLNNSEPLKTMPIMDQDGVGMCYAFSSSALIEFELRKKGIKRSISPIDAALVLKQKTQIFDKNLESGFEQFVINDVLKYGAGSKECIDKIIQKEIINTKMTVANFINMIQKIYIAKNSNKKNEYEARRTRNQLCDAYGVSPDELNTLIQELDKPLKVYLAKLFEPCRSEKADVKKWNLTDYDQVMLGSDNRMQTKLNSVLIRKKPAVIGLCAEVLEGAKDHHGIKMKGLVYRGQNNSKATSICSPHSVLVTAQKKEKGICQYLIRNSWGADWDAKGKLVCACRTDKNYYPDCSKAPKNDSANKKMVGCWIPETDLIQNTMNVGGFD